MCSRIGSQNYKAATAMGFLLQLFRKQKKDELTTQAFLADYIQISDSSKPSVLFQVAEKDALRVLAAFSVGGVIRFTTPSGRHCVINLDCVPALRHFKAPMNSTSPLEIEGAPVQLANAEPVDIPIYQNQVERLFIAMAEGNGIAEIGEWRLRTSNIVAMVVSEKYNPNPCMPNQPR